LGLQAGPGQSPLGPTENQEQAMANPPLIWYFSCERYTSFVDDKI
jgi:hypothetical protein